MCCLSCFHLIHNDTAVRLLHFFKLCVQVAQNQGKIVFVLDVCWMHNDVFYPILLKNVDALVLVFWQVFLWERHNLKDRIFEIHQILFWKMRQRTKQQLFPVDGLEKHRFIICPPVKQGKFHDGEISLILRKLLIEYWNIQVCHGKGDDRKFKENDQCREDKQQERERER